MYDSVGGMIRRKGMEMRFRRQVPRANRRRNLPISSLKIKDETLDQKKALRPKAAKGKAVAVPR
jgi:hypothetical protein